MTHRHNGPSAAPNGGRLDLIAISEVPRILRLVLVLVLVLVVIGIACANSRPGTPFQPAPPPPDHLARVYLYRADVRGSLARVQIKIDDLELGRLRNGEYETLLLPVGVHRLRIRLRGFGFLAWGWNDHRFRLTPGQTHYLKLSVRLSDRPAPQVSGIEIAGRPSGSASENVYIAPQSAEEAHSVLEVMTRSTQARPE